MRKTICGLLAFIGVFVAVCTVDGSEHELLIRASGVATCAVFAVLGGFTDIKTNHKNKQQ